MITDVSDLRLEKAKECGIDVCVNTRNKNFGEAMEEKPLDRIRQMLSMIVQEITLQWDRRSNMQEKEA